MTKRCDWCGNDPLYIAYHDTEWGVPEYDSRALWEKLILDGFQAGLSWITILKKRDNFRSAFQEFNPEKIAAWGPEDVERCLENPGIVRHRGKIEATIGNAQAYLEIPDFSAFCWSYVDGVPLQNHPASLADVPGKTPLSVRFSKDLKAAGFKFCGPTITYAWMQACGLVNDHVDGCPRQKAVQTLVRKSAE